MGVNFFLSTNLPTLNVAAAIFDDLLDGGWALVVWGWGRLDVCMIGLEDLSGL